MKVVWLDTETTGVNPEKHAIVQIAGIIEIDFEVKERFNFFCNPMDKEITKEALQIIHKTEDDLYAYPHPSKVIKPFMDVLGKYCNKYDKTDKYIVGGYNVKFDTDMLHFWCKERGEQFLGSFLSPLTLDPMQMLGILEYLGMIDLSGLVNRKLSTICAHFGIPLDSNAHNAEYDIEATRQLAYHLLSMLEGLRT